MSPESLDRNVIVQDLINTATEVKRRTLDASGPPLTWPMAISHALLRMGRTYLVEGFRMIDTSSVASSIDYYINENMPPLQAKQFSTGLCFGILGSAIMSVKDHQQYLAYFNNYITGTPLPTEPTNQYKQAESVFQSRGMLNPEAENRRLEELLGSDPTLGSILLEPQTLPLPANIHLFSLSPVVRYNLFNTVIPIYKEVLTILDGNSAPAPQDQLTKVFHTRDQEWLKNLGGLLDSLGKDPAR